jgi:hypothetical protein
MLHNIWLQRLSNIKHSNLLVNLYYKAKSVLNNMATDDYLEIQEKAVTKMDQEWRKGLII